MSSQRAGGVRDTSTASNVHTSDAEVSYDVINDIANGVSTEKPKRKKEKKNNNNTNDDDIMLNTIRDIKVYYEKQLALAKSDFTEQTKVIKAEFKGQVEALHQVVQEKDKTILKLQLDVEDLKKSYSFLSDETTDLKGKIKTNEISIESTRKTNDHIVNKASDLEDRSRRNNIVFYNIPEQASEDARMEDCEAKIEHFLKSRGFFQPQYGLEIDRAHRLGRKQQHEEKPRPVIVRFTFYKDKEAILNKGRLFMGSGISASQDFSKITLDIHKKLRDHAKNAQTSLNNIKNQNVSITHYKVTYRRVTLTYTSNKNTPTAAKFTRSFSLEHIEGNKNWHVPPTKNTYASVAKAHPQDKE